MSAVSHSKSLTQGDFAGTVTVFNSQGSTVTAAATDLARPADWNSAHQQYITIYGNTEGTANATATNVQLAGGYGIELNMGTNAGAATISIEQKPVTYYANLYQLVGTTTMRNVQSTSIVQPFYMAEPLVADFIRLFQSGSNSAASTTTGTTANTTFSAGMTHSHNFVIYSQGTGGNSMSLQYVTSTQVVESFSQQVGAGANGSQYSVTLRFSLPMSTGTSAFNKDWSASTSNISFTSSGITGFTGFKQVDYYFPMTLNPGMYWLAHGISTSATSNGVSAVVRNQFTHNFIGVSQGNNSFGTWDSATNSSVAWQPGFGSFTTGGAAGTTASIPISAMSTSASNNILYFQLMRIT